MPVGGTLRKKGGAGNLPVAKKGRGAAGWVARGGKDHLAGPSIASDSPPPLVAGRGDDLLSNGRNRTQ